ncbi:hypothetical protein D3C72_2039290 [compost metagenome]
MPELAGIAQADVLAVLDNVGDDEDFRVSGQQELLEHMDLQHTEAAAEGNLLFGADVLVAKHQHMVVEVRAVNPGEVFGGDCTGQVQADDFGTDSTGERTNFEALLLCAVDR